MKSNRELLPDRLLQSREILGYTQKDTASILGVKSTTYSSYEKGNTPPSCRLLLMLAERGFNVNWVLTGRGEMLQKDMKGQISIYEPCHEPQINAVLELVETLFNRLKRFENARKAKK